jgi:SAM-dependent methyltransferase
VTGIRDFEYAGWRVAAATYDGFAAATALFVAPLLQAAGVKPGVRLLDVACGTGVGSAQAAALGARVTGVDFSPEMIAEAEKRHPQIAFHTADAEQLPFADASFDAVVANFGIHHVERPQRAIAQARRVLAPGGIFAFTFWAAPQDNTAWRLIFEAIAAHGRTDVPMPAGNDAHATPENFSRLVAEVGFDARTLRCELIEKDWELPRETDLVSVFETGTVRMATLLRGQGDALPAIRRHVAEGVRLYTRGEVIALPTRAWLIAARASGT